MSHLPVATNDTPRDDEIQPNDPTLGECLRAAYANSQSIPPAIAKQLDNQFQLPAHLVTPREESEITDSASNSIPKEFITVQSRNTPDGNQSSNFQNDSGFSHENSTTYSSPQQNTPYFEQNNIHDATFSNNSNTNNNNTQKARITPPPQSYYPRDNYNDQEDNTQNSNSNGNHFPQTNSSPVALSVSSVDPQQAQQNNMTLITAPNVNDQRYSDITKYLNMPQNQAAKHLGIPPSTLSKRWREAAPNRKWPYRTVCKIDKEITTLLHNIPQDGVIPPDIEKKLSELIAKRQEELKTIVVRL